METIDLAYVGRGIHEELTAHVAGQQGFYADEGVHVAIRDGIRIDEMPDLAVDYISSFLPRLTRSEAAQDYERYVHPYFTDDGHVDFGVATTAVTAIADELGVAAIPPEAIYRFGC